MNAPPPELAQLRQAHTEMLTFVATIPDDILDWQPADGEWSLKETIAHVAHAYDFYILIVEQARACGFTTVTMRRSLPGWRALFRTDAAVKACPTTSAVVSALERAHTDAISIFQTLTTEELDRPFTYDSTRPDEPTYTTTLRHRVLHQATNHYYEHIPQIQHILAQWTTGAKTIGEAPDELRHNSSKQHGSHVEA